MPRLRLLPPVEAIYSHEAARPALEYLQRRNGPIAIDTETTGLRIMQDKVLFWSMATEERRFFFPADLLHTFDPLFRNKEQTWYLANAKYDAHILGNHGVQLPGKLWDIIIMDAMDDDTRPHGLKEQSRIHFGAKWGEFKELFLDPERVSTSIGLDRASYTAFKKMSVGDRLLYVAGENPELVENYATCDAYFTYLLAEEHKKTLASTPTPTIVLPELATSLDYFEIIEVPLTTTLFNMERRGIKADLSYRRKIDGPLRDGIQGTIMAMEDILGTRAFNPDSKDDLRELLYGEKTGCFGLKPVRLTGNKAGVLTSTRAPTASVDEKALALLRVKEGPDSKAGKFLTAYAEYVKLSKLHGTYVRDIARFVHHKEPYRGACREDDHPGGGDGRIHARINQAGARTSRLSVSEPGLQQIPVKNDKFKIRGIFCAEDGKVLISRDYPQIEFRVAAALAGETEMMNSIRRGWDIHSANAARMYGAKHEEVTYEAIQEARRKKDAKEPLDDTDRLCLRCRDGAKIIGLGTMYGEGKKKIASDLGCTVQQAQEQIDFFFDTNPMIAALTREMQDYAYANGHTYTMLGRMRRLHQITSEVNHGIAAAEMRQALNTNIQGSSAEMLKLAMIQLDRDKEFAELGAELLLTVHDELIAEAPEETADRAGEIMDARMGDPYNVPPIVLTFPVPVTPDGTKGFRWSELK